MKAEQRDLEQLADALESGDAAARLEAIAKVARQAETRLPERALEALVRCLGAQPKAVRRRAADALAAASAHDQRVVSALRVALDSPEPHLRWGAVYTLGLLGGELDRKAQKALLEALSNPDGDVRWAAAALIVRLGAENPDAVRGGLIALETQADHNARKMALYCLRDLKFSDPEVRAMVERASRAAEAGVRLAALSLLARLEDAGEKGLEIALRCLQSDPDPGVRRAAAVALGRLGARSKTAAGALEHAAQQAADPSLRKAARLALDEIRRAQGGQAP